MTEADYLLLSALTRLRAIDDIANHLHYPSEDTHGAAVHRTLVGLLRDEVERLEQRVRVRATPPSRHTPRTPPPHTHT